MKWSSEPTAQDRETMAEKGTAGMPLNLIHNPATLTYEQFHAIDRDCFPNEPPLSFERFNEMRTNHLWAAFVHDDFAGYAYVIMKPQYVHLSRIAVGRQYRQKGIATELMRTLVGYGMDNSQPTILLYVQTDNQPAIQLYRKFDFRCLESSYQFIVPIREVISKHGGTPVRNIKAISVTRHDTHPKPGWANGQHENKSQNSVPKRYQLQFIDDTGAVRGSCRLDPDFPGCSPFVVDEPDSYLMDALIALERYLNPARDILKLTFSGEQLERTCRNLGFRLNYELVKMERTLRPGA